MRISRHEKIGLALRATVLLLTIILAVPPQHATAYSYIVASAVGGYDSPDGSNAGTLNGYGYSWLTVSGRDGDTTASSSTHCSCGAQTLVSASGNGPAFAMTKYAWSSSWADLIWEWDGPPGQAPGLDCEFQYDGQSYADVTVMVSPSVGDSTATVAGGAIGTLNAGGAGAGVCGTASMMIIGSYDSLSLSPAGSISPQLPGDQLVIADPTDDSGYASQNVTCTIERHDDTTELAVGGTTFSLGTSVDCDTVGSVSLTSSGEPVSADAYKSMATARAKTVYITVTVK